MSKNSMLAFHHGLFTTLLLVPLQRAGVEELYKF